MNSPHPTQRHARTILALACAASLLAACGGGGDGGALLHERVGIALESTPVAAPAVGLLAGFVHFDQPVEGAEVTLRTPEGQILATAQTSRNGDFLLEAPARLPRDFLLTATGAGATPPFAGTLMLVQDDFDSTRPTLRIGVASTLAAHVLDAGLRRRPGYTPAEAFADVRRYLGLPAGWDLGREDPRDFDVDAFLQEQEGRPLDEALADLAARIVTEPELVRPYRRVLLGGDLAEDAIDAALNSALDLSAYGLEYLSRFDHPVTEFISGWGMTAVNWLRGPDHSARFDQIDRKLQEMSGVINSIDRRVAQLDAQVAAGFTQVQADLERLKKATELQAVTARYQEATQPIAAARKVVLGLHDRYRALIRVQPGPQTPRMLDNLAEDIMREVPQVMQQLQGAQKGNGLARVTSAAATWHQLVAATSPHYPVAVGSAFFDALNQQQDQVAGLQVLALNLLMEAHNYEHNKRKPADALDNLPGNISDYARDAFEEYSEVIRDTQSVVAYPRIDPGLVANLYTGRLYVRHAAAIKMERNCTQLHLAWTERGSAVARELRTPTPDCEFRFVNATNTFNAMRPFGHDDWSIAAMPGFVWDPKRINFDVAVEAGYDFSAVFRHTQQGAATQMIGVAGGQAVSYAPMYQAGGFTVFSPPVNSLRPLQEEHAKTGRIYSVFFSRPIPIDEPLVRRCNVRTTGEVQCSFGS